MQKIFMQTIFMQRMPMPAIQKSLASLLLVFTLAMTSQAEEWNRPEVPNLGTELVMELKVLIGPLVNIGQSELGQRRFIPITGGSFEGRGIKGEVMDGGADWQLTRPDGVTEIRAVYAIRTDDGQVIAVDNQGIIAPPAGEAARPYVRTTPRFQAPVGKYDWLNKRVFTGTITPSPKRDFVTIRVFEIK